ncbi:probable cleavage and polyadenylation specificity factor subunit 2 [Neocloeon triangulifer]|uniref:probable cleavage and polyadenylation specificity factor subunit 2 n=1 Tax=Neocloeon triangulifer TaxID=2078957 RepID=UPI00286F64C6|nr:probable cleavage and polyadenylation specificity factor subunit 2 [Neocloeon triangulifer]
MPSIIKLHAISGAQEESPPCYLLQVDEFRFLLDCGWDEKFNPNFIKELKRYASQIDAVLLSFPDHQHLGALPYMVGKCGLNCPIYATIPVYKMGQMFMYDLYQSRTNMEDFDIFSLDDVDAAFDKIIQLKYNQTVALKGKGYGLSITPLPAGHMIGGTMWKVVKMGEEDIVYAIDFNHKKERHLNGCELEKLARPSLLITDAFNSMYEQERRRIRDEKLMTNILQTLRKGGNVLISVDTAGRVLEISHMLDQLWRNKESGLMAYSVVFLNNVSYNVVEFAKSQIEWMSDKLMRTFEGARNNPFQFKYLQLCHSIGELNKVPNPKVVLASSPDMESGFSRDLFLQWCSNPLNSIIITSRTTPGTLARNLIDQEYSPFTISLDVKKRVPLEGAELDAYLKIEKGKNATAVKRFLTSRVLISSNCSFNSTSEEFSSDESDNEMEQVALGKHDLVVKQEVKTKTGFFKSNKKQFPMYPFQEEKVKYDEYGEIIRPEDYKMTDVVGEPEEDVVNKENIQVKEEDVNVDINEVPTKCISTLRHLHVAAQIKFIDFEGRSDGESLLKIVTQLKPRRILLVKGTPESTAYMANHCKKITEGKVLTPKTGDVVDATTETHIYQVKLTDALLSSMDFKKIKDAEVAWLDSKIAQKEVEDVLVTEDVTMNESILGTEIPTLEPVKDVNLTHQATFINKLKLSDFKQVIVKAGLSAEFSGGVLWCCKGTIAVRKLETGTVTIEGCVSPEYYQVRELLYSQYAIV